MSESFVIGFMVGAFCYAVLWSFVLTGMLIFRDYKMKKNERDANEE